MTTRHLRHALAASAAAILALTLAGCGGGNGEMPPQTGGSVVDAAAPVVTITNNVAAETATGAITFTFSFNRDVGTSFTADDVTVTGAAKGAFNRTTSTSATLEVLPAAGTAGTVMVSVAAGAVADAVGTANAAASASKAFDVAVVVVPPPATGPVVLADFDAVSPTVVAGFEGAEGSTVEAGPAGGGTGRSFRVLRSGGQPYALGIVETSVPFTATRRTLSAQVHSPLAGIPMVVKIEGPGVSTPEVPANEPVVAGWQTLTWTFSSADPSLTYNKIVLLPRLGTVDPAPGQSYYFDGLTLGEAAAPPVSGTVLANFDDLSPTAVGFEGAEGSSIEAGPVGGGAGLSFRVLRFNGQPYALGVIETAVPFTATRRTLSAQVHSPLAGIPMVMKIEGPNNVTTPEVPANEPVVAGWQTLTWTFPTVDPSLTYNKIVLLPRLGTVDPAPGRSYYFDTITLLAAAGGGSGGSTGPLTFSTGFAASNRTIEGGEFGGFSGSNLDGFACSGAPDSCGSGGEFVPAQPAANSYFFYYYQTPTPAADLYMGIYVQAPGVTGGFSPTSDTAGVQVGSQTTLRFKLGQNAEWFGSATNNFMIVMDLGKRYTVGADACRLQLRRVVTPTAAAAADYAIPLSSFALVQDCAGAVSSVAQALAASPISQIAFQGVGGGIALSDGARTSGANRSVAGTGGVYPTTLVLLGGITID